MADSVSRWWSNNCLDYSGKRNKLSGSRQFGQLSVTFTFFDHCSSRGKSTMKSMLFHCLRQSCLRRSCSRLSHPQPPGLPYSLLALSFFIILMTNGAGASEKKSNQVVPAQESSEAVNVGVSDMSNLDGASALDPAAVGSWGGPFAWPVIPIHTFLLPTGKTLHYSFPTQTLNGSYLWNPQNWMFTEAPVNRPLFCSGHSYLADGRILITGGNGPAPVNEFRGIRDAHIFDPFTETWTRVEDMADGRWYPTNVTLADGRVLVFSGLDELTGAINQDVELYDPTTGAWQIVTQTFLPLYPRTCVLTSGDVFYSGPSQETGIFQINTWQWSDVRLSNFGPRYDGVSVLLPPGSDRVMIAGGRADTLVTETAEIIDLNDATPAWSYTAPMNFPRMHGNAVILPDATVMVVGGQLSAVEHGDTLAPPSTVYEPEIFDPLTETWSVMAPMTRPREYHSTAVLLPDATVLVGGSNSEFTSEIFSPPYLFQGPRPTVEFAPAEIAYGTTFNVRFTSATSANTICLIRLTTVTHSVNTDQRYVHIADVDGSYDVAALAPSGGAFAPPGYYMLFVVSADGVPSVASMIRLDSQVADCCDFPGDADGSGSVNIADVTFLIARIFSGGPAPVCEPEGDADGSGAINIGDVTYLIARIFSGGPAPQCAAPVP
jgi:Galactose oxidase-like, Early set domain